MHNYNMHPDFAFYYPTNSKGSRTRRRKNVTAAVSSKAKPNVINQEQSHKRASVSKAESTKPKLRKTSEEETLHK